MPKKLHILTDIKQFWPCSIHEEPELAVVLAINLPLLFMQYLLYGLWETAYYLTAKRKPGKTQKAGAPAEERTDV